MPPNAVSSSQSSCLICQKVETCKHQDLICETCIHNDIELVRNSVIENENITLELRQEINLIFDSCDNKLEHGLQRETDPKVTHTQLQTSEEAVKSLSLQLRRLDAQNVKTKLQAIDRSQKLLQEKIATAESKLSELRGEIARRDQCFQSKKVKLSNDFEAESSRKHLEDTRLRVESSQQITRHATSLQRQHYTTMRSLIFDNYSATKSLGLRGAQKSSILLFGQPVIKFSSFLNYNNKVDAVNNFLENLIRTQILFKDLLSIDEPGTLPFLPYLQTLLPDEKFYRSVQDKISAITNESHEPDTKPDLSDVTGENQNAISIDGSTNLGKITIQNKTIQIPISSRTANLNRRASLKEQDQPVETSQDPHKDKTPASAATSVQNSQRALDGKKIVIVPHKILTRPFTRLKPKDYLKFVLILVKILLTFNSILSEICDRMPVKKLKHSNSVLGAISNLRSKPRMRHESSKEFLFDVEKILHQLANLDDHFKCDEIDQSITPWNTPKNFASSSFPDASLMLTITNDSVINMSLVNINSSQVPALASPSNLKRFYNSLLQRDRPKKNNFEKGKSVLGAVNEDINIYGMISETQSSNTSSLSLRSGTETKEPTEKGRPTEQNLKHIMEVVHSMISDGGAGAFSEESRIEARKVTTSMLEQSKARLDEWDMVSLMY